MRNPWLCRLGGVCGSSFSLVYNSSSSGLIILALVMLRGPGIYSLRPSKTAVGCGTTISEGYQMTAVRATVEDKIHIEQLLFFLVPGTEPDKRVCDFVGKVVAQNPFYRLDCVAVL